jgi:DNA-directed RNA polymerase specialized sigma24 family protein
MFNLTQKQYRHWRIKALVITGNDEYYADEILHYVLNKINKKLLSYPDFEVTDNYIFISLKNTYFYMLGKEETLLKNKKKYFEYQTNNFDGCDINFEDIDELKINDKIKQDKLMAMNYVYDNILNVFERKLFYIHLINGMSQREISKQSGLSLSIIHYRIKQIKQKIKNYYESTS